MKEREGERMGKLLAGRKDGGEKAKRRAQHDPDSSKEALVKFKGCDEPTYATATKREKRHECL